MVTQNDLASRTTPRDCARAAVTFKYGEDEEVCYVYGFWLVVIIVID
jgi:hypothetical protein